MEMVEALPEIRDIEPPRGGETATSSSQADTAPGVKTRLNNNLKEEWHKSYKLMVPMKQLLRKNSEKLLRICKTNLERI